MKCRVCDGLNLEPVVNLGNQPWCNNFLEQSQIGKEPYYPLNLVFCLDCSLAQLDFTVKKEIMFSDHTYISGITSSLSEHFKEVAFNVDQRFFLDRKNKSILDIGSNDGTQLKHFKKLGYKVLGVESSLTTSKIANENGVETLNEFFNLETAIKINEKFDVINASGVFFHLEELHSVCRGIHRSLKEDGIFVVQFLYMKAIVENLAFDQIYHEHLLYYTLHTIEELLEMHGLQLFDAHLAEIHGGSIVGFIGHKNKHKITPQLLEMKKREKECLCNTAQYYKSFAKAIALLRDKNRAYLFDKKKQGKIIYGFGAPVKGNTLLNYFDVGVDLIDCLVEKNPLRKNLFSPGKHIPVVMESELITTPDVYYVLAWNFKKEILRNNQKLIDLGTEFYFPINPI